MVWFALFSDEVARAEAFNKRAAEAESLNLDAEKLSIAFQQQVQDSEQEVSAFGAQRRTFLTETNQGRSGTRHGPTVFASKKIGIVCGTERDRRGGFNRPFVQGVGGVSVDHTYCTNRTHPDTTDCARMHSVKTPFGVLTCFIMSDVERIEAPLHGESKHGKTYERSSCCL